MHRPTPLRSTALLLGLFSLLGASVHAQVTPHNQDKPPGPPLSPQEALAKFELPEGFRLELVASEPDIVNPIKMTFDRRGRIWLVESLEYPRSEAGEGRDHVKIIEDTDGDGVADSFKIFADGLNIPCGIALGYGGAFVTNSPDLLFLEDTDGDDRADRREVLLSGFGRYDTHELPNTLTWGPDGWLYGLNGVFNPAVIRNKGKEYRFTCALWRYHPVSRDFEVFAEGTSNAWGLGFDREGAAFVEACVIDHLFHLTETGYYRRQAGQYPPFTWIIESIVKHKNYKAAYCGLDFYDAEVYPEEYRGKVYYGNIHGSAINTDVLERQGSTYFAKPSPIFLRTDDVWFMPVDIRLGPDGCFYVLDWYDRYHCYQDARRDPDGIDRGRGRLWRIVYGEPTRLRPFDIDHDDTGRLLQRLFSKNRWWRDAARLKLAESRDKSALEYLRRFVLDDSIPRVTRMEALWTLASQEVPGEAPRVFDPEFHLRVLSLADPGLRAWGVRTAGMSREVDPRIVERVATLARDSNPDVRLQVGIAARKLLGDAAMPVLLDVAAHSPEDILLPKIVWKNLEPLVEDHAGDLVRWLDEHDVRKLPGIDALLDRITERVLARRDKDGEVLAGVLEILLEGSGAPRSGTLRALEVVAKALRNGEIGVTTLATLESQLSRTVEQVIERGAGDPLYVPLVTIASSWRDARALAACRALLANESAAVESRARALQALARIGDDRVLAFGREVLDSPESVPEELLRESLSALGQLEAATVASSVLAALETLPGAVRAQAVDLLCQRSTWAVALLDAVARGDVPRSSINITQLRRLLALRDDEVTRRVTESWGTLRAERDPGRERVIAEVKSLLETDGLGNPWTGKAVFERTCAQCHVLFGEGQTVGPDITVNGRESLDLLLSNLLDPNLVIGKDYQARNLLTRDGRALTGLLIEDSPQRVVLRVAGGKDEVVPRRDMLDLSASEVSLMPEALETTVRRDELRDLIAYLRYDEPPPPPIAIESASPESGDAERRVGIDAEYGVVHVSASFPGAAGRSKVFEYRHSNDGRPSIAELRAPGGGPVLTASDAIESSPFQGIFTTHPDAGGVDFSYGKGWVRSRGLGALRERGDAAEILSRNDWLDERRGGKRILAEEQAITFHAPESDDLYVIDFEWRLTPDAEMTLGKATAGGLAFTLASHDDRRISTSAEGGGRRWWNVTARFGPPEDASPGAVAGIAVFDHPSNGAAPLEWQLDGERLVESRLTKDAPLELHAGKTAVLRYRIVVHRGAADSALFDRLFDDWTRSDAR